MRKATRCEVCQSLLDSKQQCTGCGIPFIPGPVRETIFEHCVRLAGLGLAIGTAVCGLLALIPWPEVFSRLLVLGMGTSLGAASILLGGLHWHARRPILMRGPIFHEQRPVVYHLVFVCGLVFSLALLALGLRALATGN